MGTGKVGETERGHERGARIINRYLVAASTLGILAAGASGANADNTEQLEAAIKAMQGASRRRRRRKSPPCRSRSRRRRQRPPRLRPLRLKQLFWLRLIRPKWSSPKALILLMSCGKAAHPNSRLPDGKFSIRLRSVVQTDYEHANQDRAITTFPDLQAT